MDEPCFYAADGRAFRFAYLAERVRMADPDLVGKGIHAQLDGVGLRETFDAGTTPSGLPRSFSVHDPLPERLDEAQLRVFLTENFGETYADSIARRIRFDDDGRVSSSRLRIGPHFAGPDGRKHRFVHLAERIRLERPDLVGRPAQLQLLELGLFDDFRAGTSPFGLPASLSDCDRTTARSVERAEPELQARGATP